ncbi:TetR/AcrR family transcriptional regulator [uncultured Clostridium sp.]|jgi:AcrR family transcriptional regulator|uniref:TetR/AcrR family transcriptional regulator n=1 Tax=uncultured Clostridium sp. TaxID=59620 RepID=UPI0026080632|nr:TetR/AcrR family transcriptional regulator [uncultured Clostridium sp.]
MSREVRNLFNEKIKENDTMTEKKKKILEVCIELFSEQGFSNVSTSQIAKAAGVAEGTIFKHFGKKEDILIKNIIPYILESIFAIVVKEFAQENLEINDKGFEKFIHAIVSDRILFLSENKKIAKILITEVMYRKELRIKLFNSIPSELKESFFMILDKFRNEGVLGDIENKDVIKFIAGSIFSYAIVSLTIDKEFDDEEEIDKIVRFLVKGLKK